MNVSINRLPPFQVTLFNIKYMVIYGVPIMFSRLDGVATPPTPACVLTVYKSSQIWREFDGGLYEFIKRLVSSIPSFWLTIGMQLLVKACPFYQCALCLLPLPEAGPTFQYRHFQHCGNELAQYCTNLDLLCMLILGIFICHWAAVRWASHSRS